MLTTCHRSTQVNIHKNARLTACGRAHLVAEIKRIGLTAAAAGVEHAHRAQVAAALCRRGQRGSG